MSSDVRDFGIRVLHPDGNYYGDGRYEVVKDCLLSDSTLWDAVLEQLRSNHGVDIVISQYRRTDGK